MPSILLRLTRRKTSWELQDSTEVLRVEFRDRSGEVDLRPSVYEIEDEKKVVRAHAEHAAGLGLNPPGGGLNVDMSGAGEVVANEGAGAFSYTKYAHREIVFSTEAELQDFIADILEQIDQRGFRTSRKDLLCYAKGRFERNDSEWEEHGESWRKRAMKTNCDGHRPEA